MEKKLTEMGLSTISAALGSYYAQCNAITYQVGDDVAVFWQEEAEKAITLKREIDNLLNI